MIFNSYSAQKEKISGIRLISCGHIFAENGRRIQRDRGRDDWLLFFAARGGETFFLPQKTELMQGGFILFAPGEAQNHIYTGENTGEYYYIHFDCESLPSENGLKTNRVYNITFDRTFCALFEEIIEMTMQKDICYEKLCTYKFLYLLALLEKSTIIRKNEKVPYYNKISRGIQYINRYFYVEKDLDGYAEICNMSKFHFLRVFKETTGVTPVEYRNNIRIEHGAELLKNTDFSVEEIGLRVGFSSLAYFSCCFKKKYGVSPKEYRKRER